MKVVREEFYGNNNNNPTQSEAGFLICVGWPAFYLKIMEQLKLIKISQKTNGRCFYCNKSGEVIDHFISKQKWIDWDLENTPIKGNLNRLENLFLACKKCNSSKNAKCPEDFIGNSFKAWDRYDRTNKRIDNYLKNQYVNS